MSDNLNLTDALVYTALYSRTTLSEKNGWVDSEGRIYISYSVESLVEDLHKGQTVIKAALRKLTAIGLIETKRNFGAPSTIYVKLPDGRNTDQLTAEKQAECKTGKPDEREPENRLTDSRNSDPRTVGISTVSQSENRPIDSRNSDPRTVGISTVSQSENRPIDSRNSDPQSVGKPTVSYKGRTTVLNYRSSSKAATAASRTDSDLAEIVQHFQQVIGGFPRSALDKLQSYREVFPKELICRAFDEAAESGVRNWRYIDGILRGWQADGVRTLSDVEARREARRKPEPPQEKKMEVLT